MPDAYPVRVFQALMAVGLTLTGTRPGWGGSYPEALTVFEGTRPADANAAWSLGIEEIGGDHRIETTVGGQVAVRHTMRVRVTGYVEATDSPSVSAPIWRLRLWDDFMTALYLNDTLKTSGVELVSQIEIGPRETAERDAAPRSEFTQLLTCHFFETKTLQA